MKFSHHQHYDLLVNTKHELCLHKSAVTEYRHFSWTICQGKQPAFRDAMASFPVK